MIKNGYYLLVCKKRRQAFCTSRPGISFAPIQKIFNTDIHVGALGLPTFRHPGKWKWKQRGTGGSARDGEKKNASWLHFSHLQSNISIALKSSRPALRVHTAFYSKGTGASLPTDKASRI